MAARAMDNTDFIENAACKEDQDCISQVENGDWLSGAVCRKCLSPFFDRSD